MENLNGHQQSLVLAMCSFKGFNCFGPTLDHWTCLDQNGQESMTNKTNNNRMH